AQDADFEITNVEVEDKDNGRQIIVTFENNDVLPYPVRERYWLTHTNEDAQRIGRGGIKRLFKAVYGSPRGSINGLRGNRVRAHVREDADGFPRLSRFRQVQENGLAEPGEVSL